MQHKNSMAASKLGMETTAAMACQMPKTATVAERNQPRALKKKRTEGGFYAREW